MVIQRIQTVFIFIAFLIMLSVLLLTQGDSLTVAYTGLTAIIIDISAFLFKKMPLQIKILKCCWVLTVAQIGLVIYQGFGWLIPTLIAIALISEILAVRYINRDRKLLSSMDRLR